MSSKPEMPHGWEYVHYAWQKRFDATDVHAYLVQKTLDRIWYSKTVWIVRLTFSPAGTERCDHEFDNPAAAAVWCEFTYTGASHDPLPAVT